MVGTIIMYLVTTKEAMCANVMFGISLMVADRETRADLSMEAYMTKKDLFFAMQKKKDLSSKMDCSFAMNRSGYYGKTLIVEKLIKKENRDALLNAICMNFRLLISDIPKIIVQDNHN